MSLNVILKSAVSRARRIGDRHPLVTNALVYGSLYTLAEVSQQKISRSHTSTSTAVNDLSSVKRYAIMGTLVFPPLMTKWYRWLDAKFPCTSSTVVAKKLLLDQFLFTPWVVVIFFVGMAALEGKRGMDQLQELKQKGINTFFADCIYWLPVSALNFMFVPPWLRVAYIGLTTFVWMNVLCYIKAMPDAVTTTSE